MYTVRPWTQLHLCRRNLYFIDSSRLETLSTVHLVYLKLVLSQSPREATSPQFASYSVFLFVLRGRREKEKKNKTKRKEKNEKEENLASNNCFGISRGISISRTPVRRKNSHSYGCCRFDNKRVLISKWLPETITRLTSRPARDFITRINFLLYLTGDLRVADAIVPTRERTTMRKLIRTTD